MKKILLLLLISFIALTSFGQNIHILKSDIGILPSIKLYAPCVGVSASGSLVTNYPVTNIDSSNMMLSSAPIESTGLYGGVMWTGSSGDSMQITGPFWVGFGDSQWAGHSATNGHNGRLETNPYNYQYADTANLPFFLDSLMHLRVYNAGIGGETIVQGAERWSRDVLGGVQPTVRTPSGVTQTLSRKPQGVIVIEGINDLSVAGITAQIIESKMEYMAASAQENGIRFVICNLGGYGLLTAAQKKIYFAVNAWLDNGGLNPYGAVVVDYRAFWNKFSPADGVTPSSFIGTDLVHPTAPVGYRALANYIFKSANLPILDSISVSSVLNPSTPITNFQRPTAFTLSGGQYGTTTAYTLNGNAVNALPVTSFVPDTVWLKTTASTIVSGSGGQYGYNHLAFFTENNLTNDSLYSHKVLYQGGTKMTPTLNMLSMYPINNANSNIMLDFYAGDGVSHILQYQTFGSGIGRLVLDGGANTAIINATDAVSIYTNGITAQGPIYGGAGSQFGLVNIGGTTTTPASGYQISVINGQMNFLTGSTTGTSTVDLYTFDKRATNTPSISNSAGTWGVLRTHTGWGDITGGNDTLGGLVIVDTLNQTVTNALPSREYSAIFRHKLSSLINIHVGGVYQDNGDNSFNVFSGRTSIGSQDGRGSSRLDIADTARGITIPRLTTAQIAKIGYVKSITVTNGGTGYTTVPTATPSGGTGVGFRCAVRLSGSAIGSVEILDPGAGYNPSSVVTLALSGGGGSSGALTAVMSGPDTALLVYNTDSNKIGYYNGSAWVYFGNSGGTGVTSVATGLGLSGGPITSTGTIIADTSYLVTKSSNQTIAGAKVFTAATTINNTLTLNGSLFAGNLIYGTSPTPSISAGAGAGTSPSLSISGTNVCGVIGIQPGTTPTGVNAIIATITLAGGAGFFNAPVIELTPANAATALLSGATMVYTLPSSGAPSQAFTINCGATALTTGTIYQWNYHVMGY